MKIRELTEKERQEIRNLAKTMCANYDRKYGCLPLDGECYMFYGVGYTNTAMCKYFKNSVLPLNPQLEATLNGEDIAERIKKCEICGNEFYTTGNKSKYCKYCAHRVRRRQKNESDRKRRLKADK